VVRGSESGPDPEQVGRTLARRLRAELDARATAP
jgi:hypothetical protein